MSDTAIPLTIETMQEFLHDALESAHTGRLTITWRPTSGETPSGECDLYDLRRREGAYEIVRQALFAPIDGEVEWQTLPATSMKRAGSGNPMDSWDDTFRIAVAECNGHTMLFYDGVPIPSFIPTLLHRFVKDNWPGGARAAVLNITTTTAEGGEVDALELGSNLIGIYVLRQAEHIDPDATTVIKWQESNGSDVLLGTNAASGGWQPGATCMEFHLGDATITFGPPTEQRAA